MTRAESNQRVAVVTGARGRWARIVVARLQRSGLRVCGLDREGAAGDVAMDVDLTDREATRAAFDRVAEEMGACHVLVTTSDHHDAAPFGELPRERWERLLREQLGGAANACAAALPGMIAAGAGRVITTSSWLALTGRSGEAYFAAATGALLAFTKGLAVEVAPKGLRANCVVLGPYAGGPEGDPGDLGTVAYAGDSLVAASETVGLLTDDADGDFFVGQLFTPVAGWVV